MVRDEDSLLVDRFKKGEESAFDELVNKYMKRIYYLTYSLTSNHADALDLSQEAFIKVYKSIHKFRGRSSFYTWLYRITVNLCLNHLKRKARKKEVSFDERIGVAQKILPEENKIKTEKERLRKIARFFLSSRTIPVLEEKLSQEQ